jgi:acylglycerol lipase
MNIVLRRQSSVQSLPKRDAARSPAFGARLGDPAENPHHLGVQRTTDGVFEMPDGAQLPYREWLPCDAPETVVLALHGINDSADAWEGPSALFVAAGIAVIAPDQRGFGAASGRGRWPGTEVMVQDALTMIAQMRARFPTARLYLAGESMGAAVLMVLAAKTAQLAVDGYILSAPAVWGRQEMGTAYRMALWFAHKTVPWLRLSATALGIKPSDNDAVLRGPSKPGVAMRSASVHSLKGLADLMDAALAAAGNSRAPTLFLYGGKDQLVPKRAMAACWNVERAMSGRDQVFAFYPRGYHLLQRDRAGAVVTRDIINWLADARAPLPSGADTHAADWLDGLAA